MSYWDPDDRYTHGPGGTRREKYLPLVAATLPGGGAGAGAGAGSDGGVTGQVVEMVAGKPYGATVVITNVSSQQQAVDVLTHIPGGSLPVGSAGFVVKSATHTLGPFSTQRHDLLFYLPRHGDTIQFPVHVSSSGGEAQLLAYTAPYVLRSAARVTVRDTSSWLWISQVRMLPARPARCLAGECEAPLPVPPPRLAVCRPPSPGRWAHTRRC